MSIALETTGLGKRYGDQWALRDCTLTVPSGRVAALVGPNGAGKSTLLQLASGLNYPSAGAVEIYGVSPQHDPGLVLPRIGFLSQERPLYRGFTVGEMLTVGKKLNPNWDDALARRRLDHLGIPLKRKAGKLSGGQQSQLALVMALAKRPEFLLLDEPVATFDPLARREFLSVLLEATVEDGLTVLLSSHIINDLERMCDYIIILLAARLTLVGDISDVLDRHKLLISSRRDTDSLEHLHNVVQVTHTERQTTVLARTNGHIWDPSWEVHDVALEDIVLAYLGQPKRDVPTVTMSHVDAQVLR
jgi:ABC-2 type transport system ATP-binding protein